MGFLLRVLSTLALQQVTVHAAVLFQGATIIAWDNQSSQLQILPDSSLLVNNDRIEKIYQGNSLPTANIDTEIVNATGKIISPGFIDTHHHLWQTAYKTIGSNTSLADYFQKYGEFALSRQVFTTEDKYLSQLTGCLELLHAGTTTVLDHAHGNSNNATSDALFNATLDSGIRSYYGYTIHTLDDYSFADQVAKMSSQAKDPRLARSVLQFGLAYDDWSASPDVVQSVLSAVQSNNVSFITAHYVGGTWSADDNSPTLLQRYGILNTSIPIVLSHASFIDLPNSNLLRSTNQYISTTPESEFMYGQGNANSYLIQDQAALGLDTHFTFSTDMVGQARLWLQYLRLQQYNKVLAEQQIPPNNAMSVRQAFHLITRAGALALRRDDIGVIREGAKADLVVFNGNSPNMLGWRDPVAAIILHSNTGDISDVMVDGKFVKRNGTLTYGNYTNVKNSFLQSAKRIQDAFLQHDWPPLTGLFNGQIPYARTAEIDTQRGPGTGY